MIVMTETRWERPPEILFRGKTPLFWKQMMFAPVPFLPPEELTAGKKTAPEWLIVTNPVMFPLCPPNAGEILRDLIRQLPPTGETRLSFANGAFQLLSRDACLPLLERPETIGEIFFPSNGAADGIFPGEPARGCEYSRFPRLIESWVVDFQIAWLLENGVRPDDFHHFYMEGLTPIGKGSRIGVNAVITGDSHIGENVEIGPNAIVDNSTIGDGCAVLAGCVISDSRMEKGARVGPYTHLRMGSLVREGAKMGNFVEMKKSVLGKGSKSMHLTYIGDADIGENVNIGAGTITCNYDGVNKHPTTIKDNVFIGSGTELVAPITVFENSYVAAGSTITETVPANSLAVARQKQRNIVDWVLRKRKQGDLKKCNP